MRIKRCTEAAAQSTAIAAPVENNELDGVDLTPEYVAELQAADSSAFVDLPAPFTDADAQRAIASLLALKAPFQRRLDELKRIGHFHSIELAGNDLDVLKRITDELDVFLSTFDEEDCGNVTAVDPSES